MVSRIQLHTAWLMPQLILIHTLSRTSILIWQDARERERKRERESGKERQTSHLHFSSQYLATMFVFEAICLQIPKRDLLENTFCSAWVYVLHIYQITHILSIVWHTMCWKKKVLNHPADHSAPMAVLIIESWNLIKYLQMVLHKDQHRYIIQNIHVDSCLYSSSFLR